MFSSSVGRVIRSPCSSHASTTLHSLAPAAPLSTAAKPCVYRSHQRRLSSSKTSRSPDGLNGGDGSPASSGPGSSTLRATRKKSKPASVPSQSQAYPNLPSVPSTEHLKPLAVAVSSFYSLHRPLSVHSSIPSAVTEESFNSIFERRTRTSKTAEVISTLGNTVGALESAAQAQEDQAWPALEESDFDADPVRHLDGAPTSTESVEQWIGQQYPFNPPPPPQAINHKSQRSLRAIARSSKRALSETIRHQKSTNRSYKATVYVNVTRDAQGQWDVNFERTSPFEEVRAPITRPAIEDPSEKRNIRQPFLERMFARHEKWEVYMRERTLEKGRHMYVISVKRQRKLKMKKHKYKKLMKKTRNLRRRLGRL
ncbi:hypothetical protein K402DRAFT_408302 [Aulographum hederae CBS 113979]|uniref:Small ribosomal subunit protein mS38 n=1 Tax=Aulographum hederae CBS 113979 TaxID=1176131 RepID=A0A6G1GLA7_9PEZI|nr:hypothetical protein K402DRAFT_408302 [Aulographum hederae CBS 113979]